MIKTLYKQIDGFKLVSVLTPLCMLGEVVMEMIVPRLMSSIIDDGVTAGNMQHIYTTGGWMIVAALVGLAFGVGGAVFGSKAATGLARNLRKAMFRNIQTFSFANIDKYSTAGLVTRMTTDVTNIQNAYQMILRMAIRAPSSMIIAMIMSFTINRELATIYLVAVIALGGVLMYIMSHSTRYFTEAFRKYDDLNESVQENVSAIRVVKAYVRERFEGEKFQKASENVRRLLLRAELLLSFNAPAMQLTVYSCILLISWLGARLIVSSGATAFTTGELMSMLAYCMNILMSLMMLSMVFVMISMSAASARRVAEVLNEETSLSNPEHPVTEVKDGSVEFEHVGFRYKRDGREVLSDIDLNIRSGETVGIIGGTGSAKTSLVQLLPRLYDVSAGTVRIGGVDVRKYDLEVLRNSVAMVLQKNELFSGTIAENLRWGNENATDEELQDACRQAYAAQDEYMDQVRRKGEEYLALARQKNLPVILLAGRPYHLDGEVNHGIDKFICQAGAVLLSEDSLGRLYSKHPTRVLNQWTYHARLYAAAELVAASGNPRMNLVQLVSFGCGVDAITGDEVRAILERAGRIYTQIKIDEITNLGAVKIRLRSLFAATGTEGGSPYDQD